MNTLANVDGEFELAVERFRVIVVKTKHFLERGTFDHVNVGETKRADVNHTFR